MTFFSKFKKKSGSGAISTDGTKEIVEGILFEEQAFIKWGSDIEAGKLYNKKEYRVDRTIYHWGERSILNGLSLYFKTVCWNHKQHSDIKSFESIDFLSEGSDSEVIFENIKLHLTKVFGEPRQEEDIKQGDIALEWKIKSVKISLKLFQKEQKKAHLEIGWRL